MAGSHLWVKLQSGEKCICFTAEHALVGPIGFFVRGVQLPVGTPVAVQFYRGQDEVSLQAMQTWAFLWNSTKGLALQCGNFSPSLLTTTDPSWTRKKQGEKP